MTARPTLDELRARQAKLHRDHAVAEHVAREKRQKLTELDARQEFLKAEGTELRETAAFLNQLIDQTMARSIARVEDLANMALRHVFKDHAIQFRIQSKIARNAVEYRISLFQNNIEGSLNSFGGGVWSITSLVMKLIFNRITNRFPLVVFDESLAFLAIKYVPAASDFIKQMTREFNMPLILVTHQSEFTRHADFLYEAAPNGESTVKFTRKQLAAA